MTDIGQTLREARMRAKIDITDVETATKIRAKYLRALENEEWNLLPGPTFVKSFLRTYAQYLGLDSRLLVEEYKRRYERPSEGEPFTSAPVSRDRERRRGPSKPLIGPRVVTGIVIVVLILVLFFVVGKIGGGGGGGGTNTTAGTPTTTTSQKAKPKRKKSTPAKPKLASLRLVPTGSVYVCLVDNTGKKRIPGEAINPATPRRTYHAKRFLMTVGNSQVRMIVNGKSLTVPPSSGATNYVITAAGRRTRPTGQGPNCG